MVQRLVFCFMLLSLNLRSCFATMIFTYKNPDDILQYRVDYSIGSNRVDEIRDVGNDDFSRQAPYATLVGDPTGNLLVDDTSLLNPSYSQNYLDAYYDAVYRPSPPSEMRVDSFNLYSGDSLQLSSLPSDFTITTDLFKPDPQLVSIIEYFVDSNRITPGQRYVVANPSCLFTIIRKIQIGFSGTAQGGLSSMYTISCPTNLRVEFDVMDIANLPTNTVTTRTKGCVITNKTYISAIG